jgi:tetratricopeptide (TPR) repeat protein
MVRALCSFVVTFTLLGFFTLPVRAQENNAPPAQQGSDPDAPSKQDSSTQSARESEMSSSKDTRIDLSPPADDARKHPQSSVAITDDDEDSDISEFHAWDPHKAAKDVEVGDFYYKRKNYRAALERYREALVYKPNDAVATYRLAECQDKTGNSSEAVTHYQSYLKILPHGPFAAEAQKALERLHAAAPVRSQQ